MTALTIRNNLGAWANKPVIQDQVLAYMAELNGPATITNNYGDTCNNP